MTDQARTRLSPVLKLYDGCIQDIVEDLLDVGHEMATDCDSQGETLEMLWVIVNSRVKQIARTDPENHPHQWSKASAPTGQEEDANG